jgi:hypothetical protein
MTALFNACSDSEEVELNNSISDQHAMNPVLGGTPVAGATVRQETILGCEICAQTLNYTVQLQTVGGTPIDPANVVANTTYRLVITWVGKEYPGCENVAYCVVGAIGFTGGCNDASQGSTIITITTNASIPPFGILGAVGPTDCSGSLSSAQGSEDSWQAVQ